MVAGLKAAATALKKLGRYKIGPGCLYINKLADIDLNVLKEIIDGSLNPR